MLGSDDNAGIISLLIGLVLVVMCGIGISLIADTKLSIGASNSSLQTSIDSDREKLKKLNARIEFRELSWSEHHAPFVGHDQQVAELIKESDGNAKKRSELRSRRADLQKSLEQIEAESLAYQAQYRTQARADSVGLKFDSLTLRSGRRYKDIVVRGFDSSGLRIHHQGGSARISYSELPKEMQEQMQWVPGEGEAQRTAEPVTQASAPLEVSAEAEQQTSPATKDPVKKAKSPTESDITNISIARENFMRTRKAYLDARSQANTARYKASDSQKSVPGSLETWAERAERLDRLSRTLNSAYLSARRVLSSVSPRDPLLRTHTQ